MTRIGAASIILPSFNPTEKLLTVIDDALSNGFCDIIVINDGSEEQSLPLFESISKTAGCTVLTHAENLGKGASLKTGMAYFLENRPNGTGVVTIDDDGQHLPEDAVRCAAALLESDAFVLGVRDFSSPDVPFKSRIGNKLASLAFKLGIGLDISDTQTGLRAIPRRYIQTLLGVKGSRFEYETNVLVAAKKQSFDIRQVKISTVYLDGNKNTHYRALADSFKILLQFLKYGVGSVLSSGIDFLGFYLLEKLISAYYPPEAWITIFLSTLLARIISSTFNFLFNRKIVFNKSSTSTRKAFLRFAALCCFVFFLSSQLVALISRLPFITTPLAITLAKFIVDNVLFFFNYFVQKKWVYKS